MERGSERLHRSAINMIFSLVGWVAPVVVNFSATPFLLHGLGPDAYGLQNLVALVVGYFSIMDMGLDIAGVKFLAEYHAQGDTESENRLLSTNLQIYGVIGIVGMVLILLSAKLLATRVFQMPADLRLQAITVFRFGALGFLANMFVAWGSSIPQGLQRYDIVNSGSMTTSVVGVGIGLGAVFAGYGVVGYVLVRIVTTWLVGVVYFFIARHLLPTLRFRLEIDWEMLRRVGGVAMYGVVLRITGILTTSADRTLIGAWLGTTAVAIYTIPNLVSISLGQLVSRMINFLFPMTSELSSTGQYEALRDIFTRASRFIFAISTATFLPLFALADIFLGLWVGPEIATQSSGVFRLLLAASYLSSISILAGPVVPGLGYFRPFTIYAVLKGMVIGIGCAVFIGPWGIAGAGIGVLLGSVVDVVFFLFSLRHYLRISFRRIAYRTYLSPMVLGMVLAGLTFLLRSLASSWVGLGSVLSGVGLLFLVVGYTIGIFGETEKRALLHLIRVAGKFFPGHTVLR